MVTKVIPSIVAIAAGVVLGLPALAGESKLRNFSEEHVPSELIVKFKDGVSKASAESLLTALRGKVRHTFRASGAVRVVLPAAKSLEATRMTASMLADSEDVEYVEANTIIRLNATPDDPRFSSLWGMPKISAEAAWDVHTGTTDVLVGVIDTGVDYTHPDIAPNYWSNTGETGTDANGADKSTNGVDDDGNGYVDDFRGWDFANNDNNPMDDHNHGTHCAGTIGGKGNNATGVAGVNWDVGIVGLKFITAAGSGTTADAIEAIEYATTIGVDLTSNSWGGGGSSAPMLAAIEEARDAGILFVAAAGNSTSNNDTRPSYPASYSVDNIISVAATDQNDRLASFSNYGATSVHLGAPGVSILSSVRGGSYSSMSGTSMACPHVAGAVALAKAVHPDLTYADLRSKVLASVDAVSALSGKVSTGGRLNLQKVVD